MTVQSIMTADVKGDELVTFASTLGAQLVKDSLTRSQIRNIFTEVRLIETLWSQDKIEGLRRLNMLKPKMAYQTARTPQLKNLEIVLSEAVTSVSAAGSDKEREDRFARFMDLFEAILAYHRASGARK